MGNPVVHFEVRVNDPARLVAFYSELLGWELGAEDGPLRYRMIDTKGDGGIGGGMVPAQAGFTAGIAVYVQVSDIESFLELAASLGAVGVVPPTALPNGGRFAVLRDPEGNQLGLLQS